MYMQRYATAKAEKRLKDTKYCNSSYNPERIHIFSVKRPSILVTIFFTLFFHWMRACLAECLKNIERKDQWLGGHRHGANTLEMS